MRSYFSDLGSYSQIGRALRVLVALRVLYRADTGIYVRRSAEGVLEVADPLRIGLVVLKRLGFNPILSNSHLEYNNILSTQIPVRPTLNMQGGRVNRKIQIRALRLQYINEKLTPELQTIYDARKEYDRKKTY